jgi:hypothetical protein
VHVSVTPDDGRVFRAPIEVTLTDKTRAILDGWPGATPNEFVENLLAVLTFAAVNEGDPERRGRLEGLLVAIKEVGVSLTSEVLAKVFTAVIPFQFGEELCTKLEAYFAACGISTLTTRAEPGITEPVAGDPHAPRDKSGQCARPRSAARSQRWPFRSRRVRPYPSPPLA